MAPGTHLTQARVNHTLNHVINHTPALWQHVQLEGTLPHLTNFISNYLTRHGKHIKSLQLSRIRCGEDDIFDGVVALGLEDVEGYATLGNQILPFLSALDVLLQAIGKSLVGIRLDEDSYDVLNSNLHILVESLGTLCASTLTRFELYCNETSQMLVSPFSCGQDLCLSTTSCAFILLLFHSEDGRVTDKPFNRIIPLCYMLHFC